MYRYFVAFVCREGENGYRYGNMHVAIPQPISSCEEIFALQDTITRKGEGRWHSVAIISWQRFECGPDEIGGTGG